MFTTLAIVLSLSTAQAKTDCVACHTEETPGVVKDWKLSRHSQVGVTCESCHGDDHTKAKDVDQAKLPTPDTCATCHPDQVEQFSHGKHAFGWASYQAMPTTHMLPMSLTEGQKGCGGCHKIGIKSEEDIAKLKADGTMYGAASCDNCHTRHVFSKAEAQSPQACRTCHMGFDHPHWEMYSSSKHGVRQDLAATGILPDGVSAPTCQTCHMVEGDHEVRTAWGFLAVRLPLPDDPTWKADQVTILQGLGVLDPEGNPTGRLDVVKGADVARLTQEDFDAERNKMIAVCSQCHATSFAEAQMAKGDDMIRQSDHLMAEAIRVVAGLYADGILEKPEGYSSNFPDLLTFHDAPTVIETTLFEMFLKHRMRTFQGAFHNNPDYSLWYGWSAMRRDLTDIQERAATLRAAHDAAKE